MGAPILERQLLEVDETVPERPQEGDRRGVDAHEGPPSLGPVRREQPSQGSLVKIPQKRLLEIVVQQLPTIRVHHIRPPDGDCRMKFSVVVLNLSQSRWLNQIAGSKPAT